MSAFDIGLLIVAAAVILLALFYFHWFVTNRWL